MRVTGESSGSSRRWRVDRLVQSDRRGRSRRGGGGIAEERLFNGRISEIVRTYICWQIYESAFLLKWGKLLLLPPLLLLLPPPPPPPLLLLLLLPPPPLPSPPLLLRSVAAATTITTTTAAAVADAAAVAVIATTTGFGVVLVVMVTAVLVEERSRRRRRGWRMAKGEGKYPNPGSPSLASPSTLRATSPLPIEGSLALSILSVPPSPFSHRTTRPRSRSPTFDANFPSHPFFSAISLSISHCCNFPAGDLYDVKICVVYLTASLFAAFRRGRADLSKYLPNNTRTSAPASPPSRPGSNSSLTLSLFLFLFSLVPIRLFSHRREKRRRLLRKASVSISLDTDY